MTLISLHDKIIHAEKQVRNCPKSYSAPSQTDLPCDLPRLLQAGDRVSCRITVIAQRDIAPGEELTISYVPVEMPKAERQTILKEHYGFTCLCHRCRSQSS